MPNVPLSEARVRALKPRKSAHDVRDAKLRAFGVRVLPSGAKRFFIHSQHRGERVWKTVGDANAMRVDEARERAASMLDAIRRGGSAPLSSQESVFETVAAAMFQRHARNWKPRTLYVNRSYFRRQLLPWFSGRQIADIGREDVKRWFASLRTTPVAADRSTPVLSLIFQEAELLGHRSEGSNPCRGMRRYSRKGRERFLSDEEIGRVAARLAAHEHERPLEVAALRLLLLTGCRKSEILTLRWSDYREGHLFLPDSKTGPRTVWICFAARDVLRQIDRSGPWLFPGRSAHQPRGLTWLGNFWNRIRSEADVADVRLHDLRHTYASFALRQGESVLAIGRLLGHSNPKTTLKYTHLADEMVRESSASASGRHRSTVRSAARRFRASSGNRSISARQRWQVSSCSRQASTRRFVSGGAAARCPPLRVPRTGRASTPRWPRAPPPRPRTRAAS